MTSPAAHRATDDRRSAGERGSAARRAEVERAVAALPGITRLPSRHGDRFSFFLGSREIAHFHGDARMDVRLTKERIAELRAAGQLDPRVLTRGRSAEWATLPLLGAADVGLAVELVAEAVRANA